MSSDVWNPDQYLKFKTEREQPFADLLTLIRPDSIKNVIDLGCGTGELTRKLHTQLSAQTTLGVDASPAMIERAHRDSSIGVSFTQQRIEDLTGGEEYDLVFSHAALHWCPDHRALFERLKKKLRPHGQLAIQMPANSSALTHTLARQLSTEAPYSSALSSPVAPDPVLGPSAYATLLHSLGFAQQHVRLQVYPHILADRSAVIDWVKGTTLTRYQSLLPPETFTQFLAEYERRWIAQVPDHRPFFFPFPRMLIWAQL